MPALPVLSPAQTRQMELASELERIAPGQVRFGRHDRMLYSTDASIYQVTPIGIVVPRDVETLARVTEFCGRSGVAMLPRGGGTSLPGQCTNNAVVVDHSAFCRGFLEFDAANRTCRVEAGITLEEINRQLDARRTGLFFAPDPATSAQASIGGCIGNNAAGARSIRYGRTSESIAALEIALTDGRRTTLAPGAGRRDLIALDLAQRVIDVITPIAQIIRQRYPKTVRRNAGYGLDMILAQMDRGIAPEDIDLTGLICGSEGTLAVVLTATLKLHPIPRSRGLAIISFASLQDAINAVVPILSTQPSAVELLDDMVLTAARGNAECRGYMDLLADINGAPPPAVLYVEYQEDAPTDSVATRLPTLAIADAVTIDSRFAQLRTVLGPDPVMREYHQKAALLRAWALRKAGEPLLHGLSAHQKPVTCVEDNAVPPQRLAEFVSRFRDIVTRHGTKAAYYAHASVGVLHVRPMLDLHEEKDRDRLRAIALDAAQLARDCGGVMSGEHGDGRLRGPLLREFYGPEIIAAFGAIKKIFDPAGVLNPGNIVGAGPIESITENLRVAPAVASTPSDPEDANSHPHNHPHPNAHIAAPKKTKSLRWPAVETYFDYSDQEGFPGAVEMCNGAGVCRKTAGGTMCPSYRATLDERHTTRGRANALRLAITGQLDNVWGDAETLQTLSLCLSCKACKAECPSNVDMAKLKSEYLAQTYRTAGTPLQARLMANIRRWNALGSSIPAAANWLLKRSLVRKAMHKFAGIAPQRSLPRLESSLYAWWNARRANPASKSQPTVALFADCFTTYNEPHIGRAAVAVLDQLGYRVVLPRVGCCGRSMISTGLLPQAIQTIDATLDQLKPFIHDEHVRAVIVCEPSCLSAMRDDWLSLTLRTDKSLRQQLAAKAMAPEEFIHRFWADHPVPPSERKANQTAGQSFLFHGHCHQKAVGGLHDSTAGLQRFLGQRLQLIEAGCCGMAGSFGFDADKYDLSMKIAELALLPALRAAPDAKPVAAGTSCRHQILDATGRHALHPIEVIAAALAPPAT